uniref:Uncharacterized protein n=1 Tax=Anguilla anguilla TaxID=7936 RepID=A0A0E9PLK6_ANGAN
MILKLPMAILGAEDTEVISHSVKKGEPVMHISSGYSLKTLYSMHVHLLKLNT